MKKENLHNITASGFKTPTDYFETFDENLFEKINTNQSINNVEAPGFTIPENYFNTVEDDILVKITNQNKPIVKLKSRRSLYYISGIAASFILLFSLVFNTKNTVSLDTIDTVAIESYLYQEEYSNDDLASLFNSDEISVTDFIDVTISEEILDEYLETIDTEDFVLD